MQNREGFPKAEQELMRYPVKQEKVFRLHVKYGSGLSIAIHVHVCFTTDVIRQCLWYVFTVAEYIHHILFAVMPLVGIAQFNTDPLEIFVWQSGGWSNNPSSKTVQEATDIITNISSAG